MRQKDDWHLTESVNHELGRGDPFAAAIRGTRMPMVITDPRQPDNPIVFANAAFQTLTGYDLSEIIGQNCRFLQGPDSSRDTVAKLRDAIAQGKDVQVDLLNYRKDGSTFWNALFLSPVRNAAGEVEFFFASQLDVTDRVEAQEIVERQKAVVEREVEKRTADLKAALETKTLLLHEVDHRVKNNLMMIGSLLRLQTRTIEDPALAASLNSMLDRVDALSTVHRKLYQSDDITRFDVGSIVETMVGDLVGSSGRDNIETRVDVESIQIPAAHASAVGLIVNEALTNALKHGFPEGRPGVLTVSARKVEDGAEIVVQDDGPGMLGANGNGLGRTLINRLAKQAGGDVRWLPAAPGMRLIFSFPVPPPSASSPPVAP